MEEEITPSPEYIKGFNEGYLFSKEIPELAKQLDKTQSDNDRHKGFKDGRMQLVNERVKEQRDKLLERPWDKLKEPDKDLDKNKDMDKKHDRDIEPER